MSEQVTAIVLAAGAGTRMKSRRAKVLHEVAGRPMLGHALDAVRGAGIDHVVTVVGHDREQVEAAVTALDPAAVIAVQTEQRGTGDAVRVALDAAQQSSATYLVTYADVPLLSAETLRLLIDEHRAQARAVTILSSEPEDPTGYGRILRDERGSVTAIREHKDATEAERATREVNSGILVVDGAFLDRAVRALSTDNAQAELYLTDIVGQAVSEGLPVGAHVLEDVWQTEGVNDRRQLVRLGRELNARVVDRWLAEGVTIVDPATTWIDTAVTIGRDTTILPGTQLLGATTIGEGVTIGPDTTLRNVEVGDDATIVRTHGTDSVVGSGVSVGPFAYLRPGNVIGDGAKVGTYVELKNSTLGPGAKVPHLSYIGDAEVGEGTNLGAGAITANYDGVNKHRTQIGAHVKTGCHNVFVAPVTIGDGAFTGAGAVVREDVAPGALAVPASGQRTIEGWVASRRPGTSSAHAADQNTQETNGGQHQEPQ
ncbi:bifunctional UDP-N-acetylglucosamine diphosphorylase/glucosamine-1-phosphate N-acetyltransferase GlmU [Aeromicrobium sp.]|uniref:bifunctional UDP-N-acetylglucosamine diphosphorylase/glucosamine-1-phosphate N-acetyltransferase GlmU n=1 Tax=Aeromicrobium sp. TaxID=1871063 RepID=UPI0028AB23A5|nr:bifunctional UDP-N-acetylglucosamine diphosphorylase/glucosamine-1-phosphate N-acetyltransferase GlmU [Aeromicrobium sp.]